MSSRGGLDRKKKSQVNHPFYPVLLGSCDPTRSYGLYERNPSLLVIMNDDDDELQTYSDVRETLCLLGVCVVGMT